MYAITIYVESEELDILPLKWIIEKDLNISEIIKNKETTKFYYPNIKNSEKINKAILKRTEPQVGWDIWNVRILSTADSYSRAKEKLKMAETTSNIESSDDELLKKRKMKKRVFQEELYDNLHVSSSDDDICNNAPDTYTSIIKLPTPPVITSSPIINDLHASDMHSKILDFGTSSSVISKTYSSNSYENEIGKRLKLILEGLEELKQNQKLDHMLLLNMHRQFNGQLLTGQESIKNNHFPLKNKDDLENLEALLDDEREKMKIKNLLVGIGGFDLNNLIKRIMRYIFSTDFAKQCNMTGKCCKIAFINLKLFDLIYAAAKVNPVTSNKTKAEVENEMRKWFANARDRGLDGRKKKKVPTATLR